MTIHWFLSTTVREATDMKKQVRMLLNEQRDVLKPQNIEALEGSLGSMEAVLRKNPPKAEILAEMEKLEKSANSNLKPYPAAGIRENIKEVTVALATILAFTTFFLQLTKIPTGSMQPTLFGITDENLLDKPDIQIPNFLTRVKDYWVWGIQYEAFVAPEDGVFNEARPPQTLFPFVKRQTFFFNGQPHTIWLPGDGLFGWAEAGGRPRAVVREGPVKKGEYVFKMKIVAGDHLLVDRFTYNFRRPERGEIIVFKTRGIPDLPQDQLYIKRLVGLPNEKIQVGDNRRLIINGRRLSAADRHFESVYSIDDAHDPLLQVIDPPNATSDQIARNINNRWSIIANTKPPYRGHVNDKVGLEFYKLGRSLAPYFPDGNAVYEVRPNHYMAMGDNTLNSHDGRAWGDFDQKSLIGKCWFVYWPFTDRFGWGYR